MIGIVLKALGRNEEALVNYELAITVDPSHAMAQNNKGK